jgi:tRNA A-37 threonylcarbamoyl transferase component Bud32
LTGPHYDSRGLRRAGRHLQAPFELHLKSGGTLRIEEILRLLPQKRLTGRAIWDGRIVLAKVFFARFGARRHFKREKQGLALLARRGLSTPDLVRHDSLPGGGRLLLIEFLTDAESIGDKWRKLTDENQDTTAQLVLLNPLFRQLGIMHAKGLGQKDIHLDNFLCHQGHLKIIDGDGIFPCRFRAQKAANLGLLMAQLSPLAAKTITLPLLAAYREGAGTSAITPDQFNRAIRHQRDKRVRAYLQKTLRNCTEFKVRKTPCRFFSVVRSQASRLIPFIKKPDQFMAKGTPLKLGNSCTLVRLKLNDHLVVIKRYNTVSILRYLKHCWRRTKAMKAWLQAHRLLTLGIATPRPLALVEERMGFLRGRAWLVCEQVAGDPILAVLERWQDDKPPNFLLKALQELFTAMYDARITHGDMKGTNLLWDGSRLFLLDLDGARSHRWGFTFKRTWQRDRQRFLRNWEINSKTHRWMSAVFPCAK